MSEEGKGDAQPGGAPQEKKRRRGRWLIYLLIVLLVAGVVALVVAGWEFSNSVYFCSNVCHSIMYPYATVYEHSTHVRVTCVECHMGRTSLPDRVAHKATAFKELYALITGKFEQPLVATTLRPSSATCELCHYPPQFFMDRVLQVQHYQDDRENTPESTWLILKTGGGLQRQGLGFGIHWHVEAQIYYYATDEFKQNIPWMRVTFPDGTTKVYKDVDFQPPEGFPKESDLRLMDCIDCHNRVGHSMQSPEQIVDTQIKQDQISPELPYVRRQAVEVLGAGYSAKGQALTGISSLLTWYQSNYGAAYSALEPQLEQAVNDLQTEYQQNFFPDKGYNWETYPDNIGHMDFPGCFRCHDGRHVSDDGEVIRVECNLCHNIPQIVVGGGGPTVSLSKGPEPASHTSTAWLHRHRVEFDFTCSLCHTVGNPGGTDNSSFCSNFACHGVTYKYADMSAPKLAEQLGLMPPVPPEAEQELEENPTYEGSIGLILTSTCGQCHGQAAGLDVTTFASLMAGSSTGPVVVPGNPDGSKIVQVLQAGHFATLTGDQMTLLIEWIQNGAPER